MQERSGASPVELLIGEILTDPVPIINATISESTTESSN